MGDVFQSVPHHAHRPAELAPPSPAATPTGPAATATLLAAWARRVATEVACGWSESIIWAGVWHPTDVSAVIISSS